jgi:Sulfotransferase family
VEKYRADPVSELMLELYPRAREVMLVRDFRDMIASMFAYNEKRGRQGFRRDRASSDRDFILNDLSVGVGELAVGWTRRSDTAHLLRYEDLVLRPEETLQALLAHLGLDAGPGAVEPMLKSLLARDSGSEDHRTVADPRESIGRWRRDLSDEVAAACAEALGRPLEIFGYEPA